MVGNASRSFAAHGGFGVPGIHQNASPRGSYFEPVTRTIRGPPRQLGSGGRIGNRPTFNQRCRCGPRRSTFKALYTGDRPQAIGAVPSWHGFFENSELMIPDRNDVERPIFANSIRIEPASTLTWIARWTISVDTLNAVSCSMRGEQISKPRTQRALQRSDFSERQRHAQSIDHRCIILNRRPFKIRPW